MLLCDYCLASSLASLLKRLPRLYAFWTSDPLRFDHYTVSKRWTLKHPVTQCNIPEEWRFQVHVYLFLRYELGLVGGSRRLMKVAWQLVFLSADLLSYSSGHASTSYYSCSRGRNHRLRSVDSELWWHSMKRENQQDATIRCLLLTSIPTCFGHHYAHLQESKEHVTWPVLWQPRYQLAGMPTWNISF